MKTGLLKAQDSKTLSVLLLYLALPCAILDSFQVEYDSRILRGLMLAFAAAVICHVILLLAAGFLGKALHLTAVEKAAINYGKPDEKWLDDITVEEAKQYIEEGHFAPGSMLPKVQAAVEFAESKPGRQALITLLEKARDGILGKTGTRIHL